MIMMICQRWLWSPASHVKHTLMAEILLGSEAERSVEGMKYNKVSERFNFLIAVGEMYSE